jgi:Aminoglycoside 3-N-acetyltransferase
LTTGHETAESDCGRGSSFDLLTAHDTLILGIGKPFEVLTHIHHVEDLMGQDFPVPMSVGADLAMTLIDAKQEIPFTLRRRAFTWKRNMWKLRKIMGRRNGGSIMCACLQPEPVTSPRRCRTRPNGVSPFTNDRDRVIQRRDDAISPRGLRHRQY